MEHHIRMGATRDGKLTALLHEGWEVTSRTDIGADLHANRSLIEIGRNFADMRVTAAMRKQRMRNERCSRCVSSWSSAQQWRE